MLEFGRSEAEGTVKHENNAGGQRNPIGRRAVIAGFAAALAQASPAARAQSRDDMRRLGVLMARPPNDRSGQASAAAFVKGLGVLGWHDGDNLRIDWRWESDDPVLRERYAAELVAQSPELLLAQGTVSVQALQRLTSTIPIVFTVVSDPVGQGFVASLSHPGGTITGFSGYDPPMAGKWLEMLSQINPPVAHAAVVYNPTIAPYADSMMHAIEETARTYAVTARAAPVNDESDIEAMMAGLAREERCGLLVLPDGFTVGHGDTIVALAARHRVPAVYPFHDLAAIGGLMSYGYDQDDVFQRAAAYVDRILKGAKPGDLPVQQPTKFELAINLKTAKGLGVTIPTSLLAAADEVIE